ncbi:MAG: aminotransferase class V-fold PLP-dependent enzyme [Planctomycetota bacterium JB042]
MIHLNHAGTSWPKPKEVLAAATATLESPPGIAGDILGAGARAVARLLDVSGEAGEARVSLTTGCTSALSLALPLLPWARGDAVITSGLEHHALAGPIETLTRIAGIEWDAVAPGGGAAIDLERVEARLRKGGVRLVAATFASNVTGEILPIAELAHLAHEHGALFLLDAAQAAGNVPLRVPALGADLVVLAGHKGPLAPPGVGALWIAPHVEMRAPAATCALPTSDAAPVCRPAPGFCDVGSANLPAVAGLTAGIEHLLGRGLDAVRAHGLARTERLLAGLARIEGVTVGGPPDAAARLAVVSVTLAGETPAAAERRLLEEHGVVARAGHHCAPLAHETLGTTAEGTLRFSFGPDSTDADVDAVLVALDRHG